MTAKQGKQLAAVLGGGVIVTCVAVGVYVHRVTEAREGSAPSLADVSATAVRVVDVQPQTVPISFEARGFLQGFEEVTVYAEVDGKVLRRCVDEGDTVRRDQALFELERTFRNLTVKQLTASVKAAHEQQRQAKAGLEVARAQVAEAEAAQQNALYEFERIERLRKKNRAAPTEVDRATAHKRQCDARMRMATAALAAANSKQDGADAAADLAEAQLEEARERLKRCTITSPIDGVVSMVAIDAGEYARPTQPVCEVIRVDRFKLLVELSGTEAVLVRSGIKATIYPDARADEAYDAEVVRVGPRANPASKKFPVELHVSNRRDRLMAGMFCRCVLPAGRREGVLLLPCEAVIERFGAEYCYRADLVEASLTARLVRIETRALPGRSGEVQVVTGLEAGAQVVSTTVEQLRDGQAIRLETPEGLAVGLDQPQGNPTP